MAGFVIRDIEDADIEPVIALWHAAGVSRPWNDPHRDIAFARKGPHSKILVGLEGGDIVASTMVGEDGHRGWVYYVAIAPHLQGSGHGRAMMAAAEAWLITRGIWKIQLEVREDNTKAGAFYEKLGYRDVRTRTFQKVLEP